jgi:hypothetical protein
MALVKMYHRNPSATGGPTTADVPPQSVHAWEKSGWSTLPPAFEPKAGATRTMYRLDPATCDAFSVEAPETMIRVLESEGWSVCAF